TSSGRSNCDLGLTAATPLVLGGPYSPCAQFVSLPGDANALATPSVPSWSTPLALGTDQLATGEVRPTARHVRYCLPNGQRKRVWKGPGLPKQVACLPS